MKLEQSKANTPNATAPKNFSMRKCVKITIDAAMCLVLALMLAHHLLDQSLHEMAAIVLFVLFIAQNIMNVRWYTHLFSGKYTPQRLAILLTNICLLLCMAAAIVSGISMATDALVPLSNAMYSLPMHMRPSLARIVHPWAIGSGVVLTVVHVALNCHMPHKSSLESL